MLEDCPLCTATPSLLGHAPTNNYLVNTASIRSCFSLLSTPTAPRHHPFSYFPVLRFLVVLVVHILRVKVGRQTHIPKNRNTRPHFTVDLGNEGHERLVGWRLLFEQELNCQVSIHNVLQSHQTKLFGKSFPPYIHISVYAQNNIYIYHVSHKFIQT